jgi:hypothetical protein
MNFKALLTLTAIVSAISGLGWLVTPAGMQQTFGIAIEQTTTSSSIGRLLGVYMISFSIVFWAMRDISSMETKASFAKAISATFVLGTAVALMLQLNQAVGPLGWGAVAIYAAFTLAYAYFGFSKDASAA